MWTFTSSTKTSSVDSSAHLLKKKKCQYTRERKCVCIKWFVKKKKKKIQSQVCLLFEREDILSGGGVKELLYATNNKAPRHITTLNLIYLVTHDYNPHNIS